MAEFWYYRVEWGSNLNGVGPFYQQVRMPVSLGEGDQILSWSVAVFLRLGRMMVGVLVLLVIGAVAVGVYAFEVEPRMVVVEHISLPWPGIDRTVRIAQLSDIHLGPYVPTERLRGALAEVEKANVDLLVLTGDFVSTLNSGEAEALCQEMSGTKAPLGVYAVLGNHDEWTDSVKVAESLSQAGVVVLSNENRRVDVGAGAVYLAGVGDVWEEEDDLASALRGIPSTAKAVLLAHEPDFADTASQDVRVGLQLSGHSHGGQVHLFFLQPVLPQYGIKYPEGLRQVGNMWLYTNRGLGEVKPAVRVNCTPELTIIELVPQ